MRISQGDFQEYLEQVDINKNIWYLRWNVRDSEYEGCKAWDEEEFDHKPTMEEIITTINDSINNEINEKIISGFTYKDKQIWLSQQNQMNYKMLYDSKEDNIKIKVGSDTDVEYITFLTFNEFEEFYKSVIKYIYDTLQDGWKKKDSIDYSIYNN